MPEKNKMECDRTLSKQHHVYRATKKLYRCKYCNTAFTNREVNLELMKPVANKLIKEAVKAGKDIRPELKDALDDWKLKGGK